MQETMEENVPLLCPECGGETSEPDFDTKSDCPLCEETKGQSLTRHFLNLYAF